MSKYHRVKLSDFNYRVTGNKTGPWLIFLHGLLGSLANWRRITPAFENHFQILTYDQRGHGRSFKPASPPPGSPNTGYRAQEFAGDLLFLMNALGIEKASIVGHSMGGRVGLVFADLYPERVEKLVLEDIGPEPTEKSSASLTAYLKSVPVPFGSRGAMQNFFTQEFSDRRLGAFLATSLVGDSQGRYSWILPLENILSIIDEGRSQTRWAQVSSLRCPTLVVRGERSQDLNVEIYKKMLKVNSLIKGVEIKDAGHWVHADKPNEFIQDLKDFLT